MVAVPTPATVLNESHSKYKPESREK